MFKVLMCHVGLLGCFAVLLSLGARAETPAEMKPYTEGIAGTDVTFEMVPIPGGKVTLGSPENEPGRKADEGPQVTVEIKPMWVGKFEVTWNEFDIWSFSMDIKRKKLDGVDLNKQSSTEMAADAATRPTPPYKDMTFNKGHDGFPAMCMTHHAAMEYTRWISAKTGKTYRLLTEAEWEYACRAGSDKTTYAFGNDAKNLGEYAWFEDNAMKGPKKVGTKKPNAWGIHDMHGNISEWVLDFYKKDAFTKFKAGEVEPVILPNDKEDPYNSKGGSWDDKAKDCRVAVRRKSDLEDYSIQDPQLPKSIWWHTDALFVGFRVCRPLEEVEVLKGFKSPIKSSDDKR